MQAMSSGLANALESFENSLSDTRSDDEGGAPAQVNVMRSTDASADELEERVRPASLYRDSGAPTPASSASSQQAGGGEDASEKPEADSGMQPPPVSSREQQPPPPAAAGIQPPPPAAAGIQPQPEKSAGAALTVGVRWRYLLHMCVIDLLRVRLLLPGLAFPRRLHVIGPISACTSPQEDTSSSLGQWFHFL